MNSFDDEIRGAVSAESKDSSLHGNSDETLIHQIAATFRGRMRLWVYVTWLGVLFWVVVAACAVSAFFQATEARAWIMYASLFLLSGIAIAMLKLWYMMELNRSVHAREIKRLELQLARIAEHLQAR